MTVLCQYEVWQKVDVSKLPAWTGSASAAWSADHSTSCTQVGITVFVYLWTGS